MVMVIGSSTTVWCMVKKVRRQLSHWQRHICLSVWDATKRKWLFVFDRSCFASEDRR